MTNQISNIYLPHVMHTIFKAGYYHYYKNVSADAPVDIDIMCGSHFPSYAEMMETLERYANNTDEMHVIIQELMHPLGDKENE